MIDPEVAWQTRRLVAEPISAHHAEAMYDLQADPARYAFTGGSPLSAQELAARYARLATRRSPDGQEVWCNWALRAAASGNLVGVVQATLPALGPGADVAHVAWEIGTAFQGKGFASEAAAALVGALVHDGWCVTAEIHPAHEASQRVAERAGLRLTSRTVDGERQWWADPWGGREIVDPAWSPWSPAEVASTLAGIDVPWCVAAGWSIDLFLGGRPREHEDLEIAVPIGMFDQVHHALQDYAFDVVGAGHRWPLSSPAYSVMTQTWMSDPITGSFLLDVFREPHDGLVWVCRRDPTIRRPYADIIEATAEGIPYLAPEVTLLFKAKHSRPKDEADFERVLPRLDASRRGWLVESLSRVHPGHRWLAALS